MTSATPRGGRLGPWSIWLTTGLQVDLLLAGDRARVDAAQEPFVESLAERRRAWSAVRA